MSLFLLIEFLLHNPIFPLVLCNMNNAGSIHLMCFADFACNKRQLNDKQKFHLNYRKWLSAPHANSHICTRSKKKTKKHKQVNISSVAGGNFSTLLILLMNTKNPSNLYSQCAVHGSGGFQWSVLIIAWCAGHVGVVNLPYSSLLLFMSYNPFTNPPSLIFSLNIRSQLQRPL